MEPGLEPGKNCFADSRLDHFVGSELQSLEMAAVDEARYLQLAESPRI